MQLITFQTLSRFGYNKELRITFQIQPYKLKNTKYSNTAVIILAGGQSKRAETIKGLRKISDDYWIDLLIRYFKNLTIKHIFIGLGFDHDEYIIHSKHINDITYIINSNPENGSFSTLQSVLSVATNINWQHTLLLHIDHAIPKVQTIERLLDMIDSEVVKPTYKAKSGHPIVLSHSFCCDLITKNPSSTLNIEIKKLSLNKIKWVEVDDDSIDENLNTEEKWLRFKLKNYPTLN